MLTNCNMRLWPLAPLALLAACSAPGAPVTPGTPLPTQAPSVAPSATPTPVEAVKQVLQGKVYDDDLAPMAAVAIEVKGEGQTFEAQTDASGQYKLDLPPGSYVVKAWKPTYVSREQQVTLTGAATLDFGGQTSEGGNPYFLSKALEIASAEVKEGGLSGPLTLTFTMSDSLSVPSRERFLERFELLAGASRPFLRVTSAPEPALKAEGKWDAEGKVFTFTYAGPYLAGASYTAKLRQVATGEIDNVTNLPEYEDLEIVDVQGDKLGMGRADFAFLQPELRVMNFQNLADKTIAYTPAERRWNLTHKGNFTFNAAADEVGPGLASVRVERDYRLGEGQDDVLVLTFDEPMHVVKDRDETMWNQLKIENQLVVLNVSKNADGSEPEAFTKAVPAKITLTRNEPKEVILHFPSGAFKNYQWVEATLGADMRDPAGNRPNPDKGRLSGPVR